MELKPIHYLIALAFLVGLIVFLAVESNASNQALYFGMIGAILIATLIGAFALMARNAPDDEARRHYFAVITTLVGFIAGVGGGTVAGSAAGTGAANTAADQVKTDLAPSLEGIEADVSDIQSDVSDVEGTVEDVEGQVGELE